MTERQFLEHLAKRYFLPEWVLLPQVRDATGASGNRTADAVAISTFPSRGIDLHGFEFKDSRADWLKEMKDVTKADAVGKYCAYWWAVVSDRAFVKDGELPSAWGLVEAKDGGVKTVVKAPRRDVLPPTLTFIASILRASAAVVTDEAGIRKRVADAVSQANEGHWEALRRAKEDSRKAAIEQHDKLAMKVREFEEASGVKIVDSWRSPEHSQKVGEAVKFILAGGFGATVGEMNHLADRLGRMQKQILGVVKECLSAAESDATRAEEA